MERLQNRYKKLLLETDTRFHRYMYNRINWNNRMIGLTGPRGIGKTTLVLQYIKENLPTDDSLYVTAEDFYFADHHPRAEASDLRRTVQRIRPRECRTSEKRNPRTERCRTHDHLFNTQQVVRRRSEVSVRG